MANRREKALARTAQDNLLSFTDDRAVAALARSREVRAQGRRQLQAARERTAAARGRRRSMAASLAARSDDLSQQIERARTSRVRLAGMAAELARTEDTVACIHDQLANRDPQRAAQYRRAAEDARQAATRAREFHRHAAGEATTAAGTGGR